MGLPAIPIGIEFGTVQTIINDTKVEITTFRCQESYIKGSRKPAVVFGTTIDEDLSRRDFTFNAMAEDGEGNIVDPFNGVSDLSQGILRTPIDPRESFGDDPLRMLRACRFAARDFVARIESDTLAAMQEMASMVKESVSVERVTEEMGKLLLADNPVVGLRTMVSSGLLKVLFPELQVLVDDDRPQGKWHHLSVWEHTLEVVRLSGPTLECRWAALFHDVAKPICRSVNSSGVHFFQHDVIGADLWDAVARRMKMSNEFREHVRTLIFEHQNLRRCKKVKAIRRIMHRVGDCLNNLASLSQADIRAHAPHTVEPSLDEFLHAWRTVQEVKMAGGVSDTLPTGTGSRIAMELGLKPGPELGKIITKLKKKMVDGILNEGISDVEILKAARIAQKELGA